MYRRLAAVAAFAAVLAGGCSSGGNNYSDATEQVFLRACNPERNPDYDAVCRCSYDEIKRTRSFADFVALNRRIEADPNDVPDDVLKIVSDCGSRGNNTDTSGSTDSSDSSNSSESGGFGFPPHSGSSDRSSSRSVP